MYDYTTLDPQQCEFVDIAASEELPDGERLFVEVDEHPIVLLRIAGQVFAIADLCSHDDGPLGDGDIEGHAIICPRHGARFDVRTGKVLSLPAIVDIPAYPVREADGRIAVGFPKEGP
ncbi:MAG: non-heme iron oxygenase ferredoxin subunit [Anaerolineae bacterium]|nr:MAG: non-heme iron oxygenase ferredoxin subunit [Anaerolineae bacterium]